VRIYGLEYQRVNWATICKVALKREGIYNQNWGLIKEIQAGRWKKFKKYGILKRILSQDC